MTSIETLSAACYVCSRTLIFEAEPLNDLTDAVVLELTRREGGARVTHDIRTVPSLFDSLPRSAIFPGVIVTPQSFPTREAIERLHMLWLLTDAREWRNRICYVC